MCFLLTATASSPVVLVSLKKKVWLKVAQYALTVVVVVVVVVFVVCVLRRVRALCGSRLRPAPHDLSENW